MLRPSLFIRLAIVFVAIGCAAAESVDDGPSGRGGGSNSSRSDAGTGADASIGDAAPADSGQPTDASPEAGSCQGVVCKSPPANACDGENTFRVYEGDGECKAGVCEYPSKTRECEFGCGSNGCRANPCDGIICNSPPKNECLDEIYLKAYKSNGKCGADGCAYGFEEVECPTSCVDGACKDLPCLGVTCDNPPDPKCEGNTHAITYSGGQCEADGECSYEEERERCDFGCKDGACAANPCDEHECKSPPLAQCSGDKLLTYAAEGTCTAPLGAAQCNYPVKEERLCQHGCDSAKRDCKPNPCDLVDCDSPPPSSCVDGESVTYRSQGRCDASTGFKCEYEKVTEPCTGTCVGDICKDCVTHGDCESGKFCSAEESCKECNTDQFCGDSCTNCAADAKYCDPDSLSCVDCVNDSQCGSSGAYCDGGSCKACDTNERCGATCTSCSGTTPVCNGGACVCSEGSCGSGSQCVGGSCQSCDSDSACGPSCSPCGGSTPKCLGSGAAAKCVECLKDGDCSGGKVCGASNQCEDRVLTCSECSVPNNGCANTSGNRKDCGSGARVIGRKAFEGGGSYQLTGQAIQSPYEGHYTGTCGSNAGSDHAYRIYLFAGETATASVTRTSSSFIPTIRWATNALNSCGTATPAGCSTNGTASHSHSVTASTSGWYSLIIAAREYSAQKGNYNLSVSLSNCHCGC